MIHLEEVYGHSSLGSAPNSSNIVYVGNEQDFQIFQNPGYPKHLLPHLTSVALTDVAHKMMFPCNNLLVFLILFPTYKSHFLRVCVCVCLSREKEPVCHFLYHRD